MVETPGIEPGSEKAPILADPCSVDDFPKPGGAHRHAPSRPSPTVSYESAAERNANESLAEMAS